MKIKCSRHYNQPASQPATLLLGTSKKAFGSCIISWYVCFIQQTYYQVEPKRQQQVFIVQPLTILNMANSDEDAYRPKQFVTFYFWLWALQIGFHRYCHTNTNIRLKIQIDTNTRLMIYTDTDTAQTCILIPILVLVSVSVAYRYKISYLYR